jgi:hypothetical protein
MKRIINSTRKLEDHVGKRSWWCVPVTTLTLECGHTRVYRGHQVPKNKCKCKECEG